MLCCKVITVETKNHNARVEEALKGKHSDKWKQALEAEYNSLIDKTWELVQPPESSNIVGSKWVLKIKRDANGNININRHKARLVAQGYSQKQGVDYMRKCSLP